MEWQPEDYNGTVASNPATPTATSTPVLPELQSEQEGKLSEEVSQNDHEILDDDEGEETPEAGNEDQQNSSLAALEDDFDKSIDASDNTYSEKELKEFETAYSY